MPGVVTRCYHHRATDFAVNAPVARPPSPVSPEEEAVRIGAAASVWLALKKRAEFFPFAGFCTAAAH